jgi:peptidyl-prolyl cis-trans isomerase B (cyclophilin B)
MVRITMEDGGIIDIELNEEVAPITCENFKKLVKEGFYNGLTFHRVIPGFMIQGGCPLGTGTGGPGWNIKGEFAANGVNNPLKHTRGVISMARSMNPNSAGSQFFIMHKDAPAALEALRDFTQAHPDYIVKPIYAAFGKVVAGMDVVDKIASVRTDWNDKPTTPVKMATVELIEG